MFRHLTRFAILLPLLLAACSPAAPTTSPVAPSAATSAPIAEAPVEVTGEATVEPEATSVDEEATAEATSEATEEATALTGCLEPTGDEQLISSPLAGYCFLIPAGFERSEFSDADGFSLGIYGPATTPGHRERGFVNVVETAAPALETSVQAVVASVVASMPGFTPTESSITLGGLPAIQVDDLPGQDINRKIFALNEGRLYELTFIPVEASRPDAYAEMEELYALMVESFRFITTTNATSSYAPMLAWEGEIDGACHTLNIAPDGEATVGVCGDEPTATANLDENVEWQAIQQHFGDINGETAAGQIIFQGQGNASSAAWSQALATWASFTAMEINAGRVGASNRTTLAWQLTTTPEHSGLCSQLVVLAYGYAYANQIPCDGNGQTTQVAARWLADTELDTFAQWVAESERIESELGYLDAQGTEPLEDPLTEQELTAWANAVYTRLLQ